MKTNPMQNIESYILNKAVTVEEWESGKKIVFDDDYIPFFQESVFGKWLVGFYGKRYGFILSVGFNDVLERSRQCH